MDRKIAPGDVVSRALQFAAKAHLGQQRKYTGEPYIVHPTEVGSILIDHGYGCIEGMLVSAYLHDTVEDCGVKFEHIADQFGVHVAKTVYWLSDFTDKSHGVRTIRAAMAAEKFRFAPFTAKIVKLADIISNCTSIRTHDPGFAKIYLPEKRMIVDAIGETIDQDLSIWMAAYEVTKE